jgi:hypothetical protein
MGKNKYFLNTFTGEGRVNAVIELTEKHCDQLNLLYLGRAKKIVKE